ncbi:hypothetical protein GU3_12810 [Oceanimonas sp. GK1]|nr:hypothetical protein GU3_12810 [Oceanimonas sp. GK1]
MNNNLLSGKCSGPISAGIKPLHFNNASCQNFSMATHGGSQINIRPQLQYARKPRAQKAGGAR